MAVVLGPELDVFLRNIGQDLKGKTKINYVDPDTLLNAVSYQNKVILTLQENILRMQEREVKMQQSILKLEGKMVEFDESVKRIEHMENILSEKIPLLDKLNDVVQDHNCKLDLLSHRIEEESNTRRVLEEECANNISSLEANIDEERNRIEDLRVDLSHEKQVLHDGLRQQQDIANQQGAKIENEAKKLGTFVLQQESCNTQVDETIEKHGTWIEKQKNVDLAIIKTVQDELVSTVELHGKQLMDKMSVQDAQRKLDQQFREIVDHLQSALEAVEKDEGDFKSIIETLSSMCKTLRENKADKSDINALRKQFIENQLDIEESALGGVSQSTLSCLDNESLRKVLKEYTTKTALKKNLDCKMDQQRANEEFVRINRSLGILHNLVEELVRKQDLNVEENMLEFLHKGPDNLDKIGDTIVEDENDVTNDIGTSNRVRKKCSFPSSNLIRESSPLANIPANEETLRSFQFQRRKKGTFTLHSPTHRKCRPSSAPFSNVHREKTETLSKKYSLPTLITAVSSTIIPRTKKR